MKALVGGNLLFNVEVYDTTLHFRLELNGC